MYQGQVVDFFLLKKTGKLMNQQGKQLYLWAFLQKKMHG
jgi:hypothetical protein